MIINCINCSKKFNVNSELIPEEGRTIQCGSCNHIWFFTKNSQDQTKQLDPINKENDIFLELDEPKATFNQINDFEEPSNNDEVSHIDKEDLDVINQKPKSNFTIGKLLSYIIVLIISFIAFILILDTFKTPLYEFFPDLEFLLFSFYETLKDLSLFIRDLS